MRKPFQSILWGTALLTFLRRSHRLAFAATLEKENEAENILKDMEERVKDLRDEIERVYKERCESTTYDDCIKNNYDDCLSTFPNQQCIKRDEFVMSNCDHGYSCNGECVQRRRGARCFNCCVIFRFVRLNCTPC